MQSALIALGKSKVTNLVHHPPLFGSMQVLGRVILFLRPMLETPWLPPPPAFILWSQRLASFPVASIVQEYLSNRSADLRAASAPQTLMDIPPACQKNVRSSLSHTSFQNQLPELLKRLKSLRDGFSLPFPKSAFWKMADVFVISLIVKQHFSC